MATSVGEATSGGAVDKLEVLPIGSGGEVGRSCVILTHKGVRVMLDCGTHPGKSGLDSLPLFDSIDCETIDLVLVTHFHLDHCGALPFFIMQTRFKGRVFMTGPTKAFYRMVMKDFLRVGVGATLIANEEGLQSTIERIETIDYHQEVMHKGIKFQAFNAGHVLGAAMFMVEIGGVKTLYTGDYSRVPDRHLVGAELPSTSPDVLIVESTFGIHNHEPREEREHRFTSMVHAVLNRGGRCLVPVFALGRAQELLLILEDYWDANPALQAYPIYYASSMATKCMKMYQTFEGAMNSRVKELHSQNKNPFQFKYTHPLLNVASFDDSGPCVVLASPGMLQSGISLELFERWCGDSKNGVIVAGYSVEGTIAKDILQRPKEVTKPDGKRLTLRMETVENISFCAHADGRQTKEFIQELPGIKHTILVHGNPNAMEKLQNSLSEAFKLRGMTVYVTRNEQVISIPFSVQRSAKVLGMIAEVEPRDGDFVNGVLLVSGQQQCTIVHPLELSRFTGVSVATLTQAMHIPLPTHRTLEEICHHLRDYFTHCDSLVDIAQSVLTDGHENPAMNVVRVTTDVSVGVSRTTDGSSVATITWRASRKNDLISDVVSIALLQLATGGNHTALSQTDVLEFADAVSADRIFRLKRFHYLMSQYYPSVHTNIATGDCAIRLEDGEPIDIKDCLEISIPPASKPKPQSIENLRTVLKRLYLTLFPIPIEYGWCDCSEAEYVLAKKSLSH